MTATLHLSGRWWHLLAVVVTAQFLCILDLWVVNIAFPLLQAEFAPAQVSDVAWVVNVYTIILAAWLVPAGRLADILGRRRLFLSGFGLFGAASLGCAVAPTLTLLIFCRAVQALGAGMLLPTSLGLAFQHVPTDKERVAVGIWTGVGGVAGGIGPVIGGLLVQSSWRWIFLINVPIVLAAFVAALVLVPMDGRTRRAHVDIVGGLLLFGAIASVCAALNQADSWPWACTWAAIGVGALLAALFVMHIRRHPAPLVSPDLFTMRAFAPSAVALVLFFIGFAPMLLGTTLLLTDVWSFSVLQTALSIAPGPITAAVLAPFSGGLVRRIGTHRAMIVGAVLFGLAAVWPLVTVTEAPRYASVILPSMLVWGIAMALIQPTLFGAANAMAREDLASGSAVLTTARQIGSALGLAILVALLGSGPIAELQGLHRAWGLVIATAAGTGMAGLWMAPSSN